MQYVKRVNKESNIEMLFQHRAKKVLELIHTDLCGPITPNSLGGSRFFMLIIDDYSQMTWV